MLFTLTLLLLPIHITAAAFSESQNTLYVPKETFLSVLQNGTENTIDFIQAQRGFKNNKIVIKEHVDMYLAQSERIGEEKLSPLLFALRHFNFKTALVIMHTFPDYIAIKDSRSNTALHYFCRFRGVHKEKEITSIDRTIINTLKSLIKRPKHTKMQLGLLI